MIFESAFPPTISTFTKYGSAALPGDFGGIAERSENRPDKYRYNVPCGARIPNSDEI